MIIFWLTCLVGYPRTSAPEPEIRRVQYNMEKDINKRKVLKGTRYLLLSNGEDIFDKEYKTKLDNALAMKKPISQAYYLKEQLREIWM